jgi:DNA replicative helicase MCM subunit Mcm2 (Cdc46/Mcm family)
VRQLGRQASANINPVTEVDIGRIRKIVKRDDFFDLAARSIAPSIFGHEYVSFQLCSAVAFKCDHIPLID